MATKHAGIILQHVRKILTAQETEQLSDRELLRRFAHERDEAAFAALVRRHGPMVLQSCQRVLHNRHDAEDGFQATFLVLARKAASRKWKESVGTWLYLVAHRLALKIRAGRDRRWQLNTRAVARSSEEPLAVACSRELCGVLDEELSRLSEKYRAPLVLCSLNGFTRDEAARQLGWSLGTVRRRLEQGRALLRQRLVRRGLPLSVILAAALGTEEAVQATVPLGLAQSAVQMAVQITLGKAVPATLSSSRAVELAEGVLKGMCFSKLKIGLAAILAVGIAGAGAGLGWQRVPAEKPVEEKQSESEHTAKQEAGGRPEPMAGQPVLDRYGDPLPPDAVTRMGTSRFWCGADQATQVAFTPDGSTLLAAHWGGVFIYDATTGKQFRHINALAANRSFHSMSVSPDGKYLALAANGRDDNPSGIQIWDLKTGQLVRECQDIGRQQYLDVLFSPDGKTLASYSFPSKTLYLWDAATAREIRRWRLAEGFRDCFTFSPDSKTLIVGEQRTIHFWDTATGREVRRTEDHPGDGVYRLALAQDGKVLATQGLTKEPTIRRAYGSASQANHRDNKVHLWDVATGKKLRQIAVAADAGTKQVSPGSDPSQINYFQFSPDTKTLATASGDGVLRVWDVATSKELRRWDTSGWVTAFAFSPAGKKLASIGTSHTVRLWDAVTGKELREHPSHPNGIHVLALSPDGRTLASAGSEREVRLWDAAAGRPQGRLTPVDRTVHALSFSADGRTLTMVEGAVDAPHFSPDRRTVTMHGDDGKARV